MCWQCASLCVGGVVYECNNVVFNLFAFKSGEEENDNHLWGFMRLLLKFFSKNISDLTPFPLSFFPLLLCAYFTCILYTFVRRILMFCFMITTTFLIIAFYYSCSAQLSHWAWAMKQRKKEKQILYYIIIWGAWLFLLC